jgi:hypothetical protein
MLTNVIKAKFNTHRLVIVVGVLVFAAHKFFSDSQVAEWLRSHWVARDLYETEAATLLAYGIHHNPIKGD